MIQNPALFPYKSMQAIAWRYEPKFYNRGQKNQPLIINEPNVTNIYGPTGMTCSGRMFAPRVVEPVATAKGNAVSTNTQNSTQNTEP